MKDLTNPEDRMLTLLQRISSLPMMSPPKESPISIPQAAMLEMVARDPGCGVLDIAKKLNVTAPTISVGIRRLVKDGWLEQRDDPNDRRARPIYLTDMGATLVAKVNNHRAVMLKQFLSGLSDDEKEQLICLLDRAITALENADPEGTTL
jgi:DNA-binding MarR family transcriptional regulator